MKDMISKIIEMDEKARELTDMAQKDKINSYQEIAAKREKLHDDYIKRARKRIEINYKREWNGNSGVEKYNNWNFKIH